MSFVFEGNSFCGEPIVPEIGENGNWHIDNIDTGKPSRGIQGIKGDTGLTGAKGERGIQGVTGINGVDGITPNISIGTVTTLESNQQATVSRTGTDEAPIFNFGIPKGEKGNTGVTDWGSITDKPSFAKSINDSRPDEIGNIKIKANQIPCDNIGDLNLGNVHEYIQYLCEEIKRLKEI